MNWVEKYVRIPYVDGAPSFEGCNCWGLVHLVLKTEAGVETPEFSQISAEQIRAISKKVGNSVLSPPWQLQIDPGEEQMFDVILFKSLVKRKALDLHTGIVTSSGMCLHTEESFGCVHVPFRNSPYGKCHPFLFNRISYIFRHEQLT